MNNRPHEENWTLPEATVSGSYGHGWDTTKRFFLELFILVIILSAAAIPMGIANEPGGFHSAGTAFLKLFGFAYWLLLYAAINYGVLYGFVRGARGETPEVNDIFKVTDNYVNVVLANLVTTVIIVIGFMALIVPGIYFACRLVFVPYLVVERKMEVVPALRESWDMSQGKAGMIFLMGLTAIPIALLGLLMCGVGILFSLVWIHAAFASLYVALAPVQAPAIFPEIPAPPVSDPPVQDEARDTPEVKKENEAEPVKKVKKAKRDADKK
ncbi:MAG: hypothetical protein GXO70_01070 [Acidobacteria bacterium]|nr:hypothetical protein [Acidobacteriota bacterium]